jgi:hypothetical protein
VTPNDDAEDRLRGDVGAVDGIDPERLRRHVEAEAAKMPPLTPGQIERLRRLFRPRPVDQSNVGR